MSKKLYEESNIQGIAEAIRSKNGTNNTYTTAQMAEAVRSIKTQPILEELNASANGTYTPSSGKDGFSRAVVNVQPKLEELNASANGTYTPSSGKDGFGVVHVSVAGGASAILVSKTITSNGTYNALLDDDADGYSEVKVNVSDGKKYNAVHVWTKNTGGNDAALYIQTGYYEDGVFVAEEEPESLVYRLANPGVNYAGLIRIDYGKTAGLRWTISAITDNIIYNETAYSSGDVLVQWQYDRNYDGNVMDSYARGQRYIGLSVTDNGTFLPSQYGVDAFDSVIVNVPQSGDKTFFEGTVSRFFNSDVTIVRPYMAYNYSLLSLVEMQQVSVIGTQAFRDCHSLTQAIFPACTTIGSYAFVACSSLTQVSFPVCTEIYNDAFIQCSSLTQAIFPECTTIGVRAFMYCSSLRQAIFPECTTIEYQAFDNCLVLSQVSFPACTTIGSYAFRNCSSLTQVSFPECTTIGSYAFGACYSLTQAIFPECTTIGNYAFGVCSSLTQAIFPECTTTSGQTFIYCSSLTQVSFPKCTTIRYQDFAYCSSLTQVSFPACITISDQAFVYCSSLESIYLLSSSVVKLLGGTVFKSTPIDTSSYLGYFGSIYVPESLVEAYKSASYWSYYSDRITAYTG